jgi:hypothetical protein
MSKPKRVWFQSEKEKKETKKKSKEEIGLDEWGRVMKKKEAKVSDELRKAKRMNKKLTKKDKKKKEFQRETGIKNEEKFIARISKQKKRSDKKFVNEKQVSYSDLNKIEKNKKKTFKKSFKGKK